MCELSVLHTWDQREKWWTARSSFFPSSAISISPGGMLAKSAESRWSTSSPSAHMQHVKFCPHSTALLPPSQRLPSLGARQGLETIAKPLCSKRTPRPAQREISKHH